MADGRKLVSKPEGEKVVKRVAKDGTKRGLHMQGRKKASTTLMERCQAAIEAQTGIQNWDPVVMMAMISAQALTGYPAVDEEGQPIIDTETGKQVMVPPDRALAVATAAKVAPYLHSQLRPKDAEGEGDKGTDPDETKDKVLAAFENMGVKVNRDE